VDLVRDATPAVGDGVATATGGEPRAAVERHPAHQLRGDEVLGIAARLPDPLIGLAPDGRGPLGLSFDDGPQARRGVPVLLRVHVERIEDGPENVVLALFVGAVADADRTRALVAGQVVERLLGEVALPADSVHDLQRAVAVALEVSHVLDEVVGLPAQTERAEAPQRERGVRTCNARRSS
jgi:hypothetical protein